MASTAAYDHDELEKKLCDPSAPPVSLPLQFLRDITCNFSTKQELGRGGYGVVYKGVLRCGKIIAVKKIFSIHLMEDDQFQKEARYLMGIKHKNIVKLVGYCAESRWEAIRLPSGRHIMAQVPTRLLCFEYICNQSLDKHVSDESSGLDWYKRFEIIKGICSGLHFLHEKRIVHRDLKPGNIVLDATMMPKIADFGLSRLLGIEKSATIISGNREGSLGYMAPEYIFQGQISPKADIFSFGVIIIEIITGCKMTNDVKFFQPSSSHQSIEIARQQYIENVLQRWRNIFKKEPKYRSLEIYIQQVKECITIALRCVDHDKSRRPNACEILQLLSAVESTKFHAEDSKDSCIYQVQDMILAQLTRSRLRVMVRSPQPLMTSNGATRVLTFQKTCNMIVDINAMGSLCKQLVDMLKQSYCKRGTIFATSLVPASPKILAGKQAEVVLNEYSIQRNMKEEDIKLLQAKLQLMRDYRWDLPAICCMLGVRGVGLREVKYALHAILFDDDRTARTSDRVRRVQQGQSPVPVGGRPKKEPRAAPNRRREGALQQPPRGRR